MEIQVKRAQKLIPTMSEERSVDESQLNPNTPKQSSQTTTKDNPLLVPMVEQPHLALWEWHGGASLLIISVRPTYKTLMRSSFTLGICSQAILSSQKKDQLIRDNVT
jgi:hypothetical protein